MQLNLTVTPEVLAKLEEIAAKRGIKRTALALEYLVAGIQEDEPTAEEEPAEEPEEQPTVNSIEPTVPADALGLVEGMEITGQYSKVYRLLKSSIRMRQYIKGKTYLYSPEYHCIMVVSGLSRSKKEKYLITQILDTSRGLSAWIDKQKTFMFIDEEGDVSYMTRAMIEE